FTASGAFAGSGLEARVAALETKVAASESKIAASESKIAALEATLKGVTRSGSSLEFSGMNVRVDNGTGSEETVNGLGNLSVGYDELLVTGSNNLILGKEGRASSFGDLVSGSGNTAEAPFATVGGVNNTVTAEGRDGSIAGGSGNKVRGFAASVLGGTANTA